MKSFLNLVAQPIVKICVAVQAILRTFSKAAACFGLIMSLILTALVALPATDALAQGPVLSPQQVVEFALTLEKLEADFYRRGLQAAQNGGLASAPQMAKDAIISYGEDEIQHVNDLSAVLRSLGGNPDAVRIPANPNYSSVLGRDPFANPSDFLLVGQYFEDLGVAAYKGQAGNLMAAGDPAKPILAGALEIHSVEARHAAGIRFLRQTLLGEDIRPWIRSDREVLYPESRSNSPIPFSEDAFDGYATSDEVIALVAPVLNMADAPMMQRNRGRSGQAIGSRSECRDIRTDYVTEYLFDCVPTRELKF